MRGRSAGAIHREASSPQEGRDAVWTQQMASADHHDDDAVALQPSGEDVGPSPVPFSEQPLI